MTYYCISGNSGNRRCQGQIHVSLSLFCCPKLIWFFYMFLLPIILRWGGYLVLSAGDWIGAPRCPAHKLMMSAVMIECQHARYYPYSPTLSIFLFSHFTSIYLFYIWGAFLFIIKISLNQLCRAKLNLTESQMLNLKFLQI